MENCKPPRLDGRTGNEKMTKENESLSEKIWVREHGNNEFTPTLDAKDVKEFIRKLKEELILSSWGLKRLNELAGEKLI